MHKQLCSYKLRVGKSDVAITFKYGHQAVASALPSCLQFHPFSVCISLDENKYSSKLYFYHAQCFSLGVKSL